MWFVGFYDINMCSFFFYFLVFVVCWIIKFIFVILEGFYVGIVKSCKNVIYRFLVFFFKIFDIVERDVKGVKVWDFC